MNYKEFRNQIYTGKSADELLPNGIEASSALKIIAMHLLGKDPVLYFPKDTTLWNAEVVEAILKKYPSGKIRKIPK